MTLLTFLTVSSQHRTVWETEAIEAGLRRVAEVDTDNFMALLAVSGLDRARDLRFFDWSGADFTGCDLSGCDFTGAGLSGCRFDGAGIARARFDLAHVDRTALRRAADWPVALGSWHRAVHLPGDRHLPDLGVFSDAPFAPELVVIPAGEFLMGSPVNEKERWDDEGPQHPVEIGYRFALGRYPVTFAEYDRFCGATGRGKPDDQGWGRDRRPAINVSWDDAQVYAAWLSEETGAVYRLPSEAEWEYACRSGSTTRWSFGDDEALLADHAWFSRNSGNQTRLVGEKRPNGFGLYDMHGNVREWVEDEWHKDYWEAPSDGSARATKGRVSARVVRGGSWGDDPWNLRSAIRSNGTPVDRYLDIGFRVARTLTP